MGCGLRGWRWVMAGEVMELEMVGGRLKEGGG